MSKDALYGFVVVSFSFYYTSMSDWPACVSVSHVCARCPQRSDRNWGSRRLWAGCRCWESNPGPGENSVLHHEASCQPAPPPIPHWFLFILTFSEETQNELFDPESWSLLWTLEHSSLSVLNVSIISGVHISLQPITISTSQGRSTALLADIFASFISFCFFFLDRTSVYNSPGAHSVHQAGLECRT